jgi:S-formylglutathione hydrolase FrmB
VSTRGTLEIHRIDSELLKGNALGDPHDRPLHVYLPPEYDPMRSYPTLLALAGFTGTGASYFNVDPLGESLDARLDRLIGSGACAPAIVVAPDGFTRLGGNQYINSTATGRYEDYLMKEVVPFVERKYRVLRWGVFGKSSGGYGAMVLAMRNPSVLQAVADHSGDANFELCYLPDFPKALDQFRDAGGPAKWLERYWADSNRHRKKWFEPLNVLAMAAHYSPNPASPHLGIDFPYDLETGKFDAEVWARWQAWDPVRMVATHAKALASLRCIYVDCGTSDEFALQWGARALVTTLRAAGIQVTHEEFDDGHMFVSYRMDRSLPLLVRALS